MLRVHMYIECDDGLEWPAHSFAIGCSPLEGFTQELSWLGPAGATMAAIAKLQLAVDIMLSLTAPARWARSTP